MDAKEKLLAFKKNIDLLIDQYFDEYLLRNADLTKEAALAIKAMRDYTMRGGKRLRSAFMYYGYILLGGKEHELCMKAAVTMELLQSYILIVDDYVDNSNIRRGGPTVHIHFRDYHKKTYARGDSDVYGTGIALTAGIIIGQMVTDAFVKAGFPADVTMRALEKLTERLMYTGYGQIMDITSQVRGEFSEKEAVKVLEWKTSTYTYEIPLVTGATLAGASDQDIEKIKAYARPAGIAFQLQDDLLGLYGNEQKVGKPVGSDVTEGKMTLLVVKALERSNTAQRKRIQKLLGVPKITEEQLREIGDIVKETGAYEYVVDKAKMYVAEAQTALKPMCSWDKEGLSFLEGIAEYMINRDV